MNTVELAQHSEHSAFREKLIEHLFVGELLKLSWLHHGCSLEIAKPEVDRCGYDLIAEAGGIVRHIQLKATFNEGKAARQTVHLKLAEKPSGCVIWIYFDERTLQLGPFYFFGAEAGKPLPSLDDYDAARHTKGNKDGYKAPRPNLRVLNKGDFKRVDTVDGVFRLLFDKTQHQFSEII